MKNKKFKFIAIIAGVILVAVIGYSILSGKAQSEVKAETLKAQKGEVTTMVTATGTVEPLNEVEVGTQVSGEVEKIYVDFNSEVKKGQLLAELDKTNLKAALLQAQATYNNAVNEKDYYQKIYDRQKVLFENKVISTADYDEALYNLNKSKSTVVQSSSNLTEAKTNLGYADIYSPIDGVVLSREIDEGQTVAASFETPTLFTIAKDLKKMQVEADVDEADIGGVIEGQRVGFTVDAYQGETFAGTVTQVRLDPTVESNVVTYTVVIEAENPELKLKPGLTATISIYTLELKDVLTIEAKAVNFQPNMDLLMKYYEQQDIAMSPPSDRPKPPSENITVVWSKTSSGIQPKEIKLGASDGVNVQVVEGLSEGDELVYSLKEISNAEVAEEASTGSPFMPKPPGRNNDKKKEN
ncbi:efflux RND transporter periplasmic adaptor subunit [Flagellimonas zhangzhouensis]|uniref:HlyD family secretion protein n=1 Tax=Flagellimonas zhangzhouensis TaxID=1073328 RepID=A0A1H2Y9Y8_9FLAO|nr:efflux RND transporter periplasmic adaptor subunit [Allomuricauda zhangzhouensis]SDQ97990.1 HlyD family secretion protein [Allomuricauda zhangzhouensis]SDX01850.1 HlyD family secretion protein [Allomuricauda zhangzhouensis]